MTVIRDFIPIDGFGLKFAVASKAILILRIFLWSCLPLFTQVNISLKDLLPEPTITLPNLLTPISLNFAFEISLKPD